MPHEAADTVENGSRLNRVEWCQADHPERVCWFSTAQVALFARYMAGSQLTDGGKARVLDVGCGDGIALAVHCHPSMQRQSRTALEYCGMDLHVDAIAAAVARPLKEGTASLRVANFLQHDITTPWPLDDGYWDVIWNTETLEHVPADKAPFVLQECRRVIKPDGVMLFSTPARHEDGSLVWPESHDHEYSRGETFDLLIGAGWQVERQWGVDANFTKLRPKLRSTRPELFEQYEHLRRAISPAFARVFVEALAPELCYDVAYLCRPV